MDHSSLRKCIDIVIGTPDNHFRGNKMATVNMSIRVDSELKTKAEKILSQLGMNMNGTINMFLNQIVRDKAVPLSLSLSSEQSVYADLLAAQYERASGKPGRDANDVLKDMDRIIADAEGANS